MDCWKAGIGALTGIPFFSGVKKNKIYALPPQLFGLDLFTKRVVSFYRNHNAGLLAYLPKKDEDLKCALELGFDEILIDGAPLGE